MLYFFSGFELTPPVEPRELTPPVEFICILYTFTLICISLSTEISYSNYIHFVIEFLFER